VPVSKTRRPNAHLPENSRRQTWITAYGCLAWLGKTDIFGGQGEHDLGSSRGHGIYLGQWRPSSVAGSIARMLIRVLCADPGRFRSGLPINKRPPLKIECGGKDRLSSSTCLHHFAIRCPGTVANGRFGPDLTHLMSRGHHWCGNTTEYAGRSREMDQGSRRITSQAA